MNINNHSAKGPERANHAKLHQDLGKKGLARAEKNESKRVETDKIDLSAGAKALSAELAAPPTQETSSERTERIAQLRELALGGKLNTPERAAISASRILSGE